MKLLLFGLCFILFAGQIFGQQAYWQQQVNVQISVSLNDADHSLDGFETMEYINNSPDTLHYVWFHIWPNAYKNDRTAFSAQLLTNRRTDFYFSKPGDKGYINQLAFKADNITANTEIDSNYIDLIKVLLPRPLLPGATTIITTPFHVQLPQNFSRGGHVGNTYQVTQWYPKPAVYDSKGWHPMPYLDQGEFFSEFGNYDVEVVAPSAYTIAATGMQQPGQNDNAVAANNKKTWHFKQQHVHDFAWFASKDFVVEHDTLQLQTKAVSVYVYRNRGDKLWGNAMAYAKRGLLTYSQYIGDYPYNTASIVQGSENLTSGGMEYPTITLITEQDSGQILDETIVHELGHNWFYSALASNERLHPWMDEGINYYYERRYDAQFYPPKVLPQKGFANRLAVDEEQLLLQTMQVLHQDQPIETSATNFSQINYGLIAYNKAASFIKNIETSLGLQQFDTAMHAYYTTWQGKHPYPADFKQVIEKSSGSNLDYIFKQLLKTGADSVTARKQIKLAFIGNLSQRNAYNYVSIAPLIGYNHYDKIMPGIVVHNYQLPPTAFRFFAGSMYSTGAKKINPFGKIAYKIYSVKSQAEFSISYMKFSEDFRFDDLNNKTTLRFSRLTPSFVFTKFNRDPKSKQGFTLSARSIVINKNEFTFSTVTTPADTFQVIGKTNKSYYVNQVSAGIFNNRELYPYTITLLAEQGKEFLRTSLVAKYFFNYSTPKTGLQVRFFAGKFFYLQEKNFVTQSNTSPFQFNMSGTKGDEDYSYSNYFIGRNEFKGWKNHQLMERDGFFKVRSDLMSIAETDNWLMSVNLVSDVPKNINPLNVLPVKIPLKVFADIGTYAEAWKDNPASGKFLYDAGLQLSLFKNILNVYFPILYSKVYKDYFKSVINEKIFVRNISFSIDLQQLSMQKVLKDIRL